MLEEQAIALRSISYIIIYVKPEEVFQSALSMGIK